MIRWQDIDPADATDIDLTKRLDITAPRNEMGERCPWPWEPQQLHGVPMGQYHCSYCGAMVVAGVDHLDYTPGPCLSCEIDDHAGCLAANYRLAEDWMCSCTCWSRV